MIPQLPEAKVREILKDELEKWPCAILAVRGYYRDSMGVPGVNDVGINDDAFFLCGPNTFLPVAANTDPSKIGWNEALGKPFAMLQPGTHLFIRGPHKGRVPALRQPTEDQAEGYGIPNFGHFKVWRARSMDDIRNGTAMSDEGYFAINIHSGGVNTTSSWGCPTIPPKYFYQWMDTVWEVTKRMDQDVIPVKLVVGPLN